MSGFHEILFPLDIALKSAGGPQRRTDIVALGSGREERNARWAHSRRRYDAGYGVKTYDALSEVVAFFEERRGNTVTLSHFGQNARLNLSPDGNHMSGSEAGGISITAVRTSAPTSSRAAPAQTSVAPAVKGTHASATTGSSRQRYCAAKWPAYRDAWSRMCNNEADFEDVAEGMCNLNTPTARQQFMTKCLSGEDPEMPN